MGVREVYSLMKESKMEPAATIVNPKFFRPETIMNPCFSMDHHGKYTVSSKDDTATECLTHPVTENKCETEGSMKNQKVESGFSHEIYEMLEPLSISSGESKLYLCQSKGEKYVCKLYQGREVHDKIFYDTLFHVDSPYIGKLTTYGVYQGYFYEIYPYYAKGDIAGITFSLKEICENVLPCLTQGLHDLHEKGICHGDVKPSNVMFQNQGNGYLLLDFGVSFMINQGNSPSIGITEAYAAPEVSLHNGGASYFSDYYALGVCLYELYFGKRIQLSDEEGKSFHETSIFPLPTETPAAFRFLLQGLLFADIVDRETVKQEHPLDISSFQVSYRWGFDELTLWMANFGIESRYENSENHVDTMEKNEEIAVNSVEVPEKLEDSRQMVIDDIEKLANTTNDVEEVGVILVDSEVASEITVVSKEKNEVCSKETFEGIVETTEVPTQSTEKISENMVDCSDENSPSKKEQQEKKHLPLTECEENQYLDAIPTFRFLDVDYHRMSTLVKDMTEHWWDGRDSFFTWDLLNLLKAQDSPYTPILQNAEETYYEGKAESMIFWTALYQLDPSLTDIIWEDWSAPNLQNLGEQLQVALLNEKECEGKGFSCCYSLLRHGIISEYLSLPQCTGQNESFRKLEILYRVCEKDPVKRGTFPEKLVEELMKYKVAGKEG